MIIGVAIDYNGRVYLLDSPARHHEVIRYIHDITGDRGIRGLQGFVIKKGEFLDRLGGAGYALRNNQIKKLKWPLYLYSDDLW